MDRLGFPMQAAAKYVIQNTLTRAIPASRTPGQLTSLKESKTHRVGVRTPSPAPQLLSKQESRLEGGRNQVILLYESEAGSRAVHDRVRGYTYSFHPAGVAQLYPLAPMPAGSNSD